MLLEFVLAPSSYETNFNPFLIIDDDQTEDPSIDVSNSQPSQVIYDKESKIKLDYGELEEGKFNIPILLNIDSMSP